LILYFSDRPREIETAAKVNIVCLEIKEGMFLRTTYQDNLNVSVFDPDKIPDGNFFFLIHYMDKFNPHIVLDYRSPEDHPHTKVVLEDPETWGPTVLAEATIPDAIVDLIIKKRVKILGHNDHVNVDDRYTHSWIDWICSRYPGIQPDDFVFLMPSTGRSRLCTIDNTPWGLDIVRQLLGQDLFERARSSIVNCAHRKNKFISLNARPQLHRQLAVTRLFDFKDQGRLTYYETLGRNSVNGIESTKEIHESVNERYLQIRDHFPLIWDINNTDEYSSAANLQMSKEYIDENLSTYLNIVSETRFHNTNPVWFSEKTFRPMMFLQPFIILGQAKSLQALRDRGFKTFGQWINEDYDNIVEEADRMHAALDSAIAFFEDKEPQELSNILLEMLPVLMHNYFHAIEEYNGSSIRIVNRLLSTLNNQEETTAINSLVYNASKLQHGISMLPYAIPDFNKVFRAVPYLDHNQLPELFYFQLDRGLMDIAWITAQQLDHGRLSDFKDSVRDIPVSVCQAVQQGSAKFIIYDWGNLQTVDEFTLLINTLLQEFSIQGHSFSEKDFVIVSGSSWQSSSLNFVSFNFWETYFTQKFDRACPGFTKQVANNVRSKSLRKKKFICLNGQYLVSRLATVTLLSDLRDQGILTLVDSCAPLLCPPGNMDQELASFGKFSPELAHQFGKELRGTLPWHWDVDLRVDYSHVSWAWAYDVQRIWTVEKDHVDSAVDCYLNVVTEANYQYNGMVRHTEKIFKAINLLQPFVVIGEPGQLSSLQTLGYKTFNRWIDESYDCIEDPSVRVFAAVESAREFIQKDPEELSEILNEMLPTLLHNKKLAQYRQRTTWSRLEVDLACTLAK